MALIFPSSSRIYRFTSSKYVPNVDVSPSVDSNALWCHSDILCSTLGITRYEINIYRICICHRLSPPPPTHIVTPYKTLCPVCNHETKVSNKDEKVMTWRYGHRSKNIFLSYRDGIASDWPKRFAKNNSSCYRQQAILCVSNSCGYSMISCNPTSRIGWQITWSLSLLEWRVVAIIVPPKAGLYHLITGDITHGDISTHCTCHTQTQCTVPSLYSIKAIIIYEARYGEKSRPGLPDWPDLFNTWSAVQACTTLPPWHGTDAATHSLWATDGDRHEPCLHINDVPPASPGFISSLVGTQKDIVTLIIIGDLWLGKFWCDGERRLSKQTPTQYLTMGVW